jgi:putative toxin-antitoxin system antitoxin component (TIGR02293 family)
VATALKEYCPEPQVRDDFWSKLGITAEGSALHALVHEGFPYAVYSNLAALLGLERKELAKYAMIPQTTLQRRYKSGLFSAEESDRLYRIAEVAEAAISLFDGDVESARQWLAKPAYGLGRRRPLDMLSTSVEAQSVIDLIGRIEYGVYS